LIIQCTSCQARYHYDEKRFGSAAAKKIRCTKCQAVFEIRNPALTTAPATDFKPEETGPLHSPILRIDDFSLDVTAMGGEPRKRAATSAPPVTVRPPSSGSPPAPPTARPVPWPSPAAPPAAPVPPSVPAPARGITTGSYQTPGGTGPGTEGKHLKLPDWERLSLACIAGPDAGKIFEIDRPRVVIGRANADILLSDGECSRQHAAIEVAEEKAMLIDLGSTNGTYVGEWPIQEFQLESRNEFDIGASTLMFIRSRKD
jgi:predicted Zn finger-like uncharacterized protein